MRREVMPKSLTSALALRKLALHTHLLLQLAQDVEQELMSIMLLKAVELPSAHLLDSLGLEHRNAFPSLLIHSPQQILIRSSKVFLLAPAQFVGLTTQVEVVQLGDAH